MNMTLQQAMQVATDLEERGCLNEPAKAARTLLAHINSLASPQVTDEQIGRVAHSHISTEYFGDELLCSELFNFARGLLSSSQASSIGKAIHYPECWDTAAYPTIEDALSEMFACFKCSDADCQTPPAASQEAKPVAAEPVAYVVTVGEKISNEIGFFTNKEEAECCRIKAGGTHPHLLNVQELYFAQQEQASAIDRDALIEEVAQVVWQYKSSETISSALMMEISAICHFIRGLKSQPHQVKP